MLQQLNASKQSRKNEKGIGFSSYLSCCLFLDCSFEKKSNDMHRLNH